MQLKHFKHQKLTSSNFDVMEHYRGVDMLMDVFLVIAGENQCQIDLSRFEA